MAISLITIYLSANLSQLFLAQSKRVHTCTLENILVQKHIARVARRRKDGLDHLSERNGSTSWGYSSTAETACQTGLTNKVFLCHYFLRIRRNIIFELKAITKQKRTKQQQTKKTRQNPPTKQQQTNKQTTTLSVFLNHSSNIP